MQKEFGTFFGMKIPLSARGMTGLEKTLLNCARNLSYQKFEPELTGSQITYSIILKSIIDNNV